MRARALAAKLGVDAPEWAADRNNRLRGLFVKQSKPAATPAVPREVPAALRAWRAGVVGRGVAIRFDGTVALYTSDGSWSRFASVDDAVRACHSIREC